MNKHQLKTWPQYFDSVAKGEKTFECRINDRGFETGDLVILQRTQENNLRTVELNSDGNPKYEMQFRIGTILTDLQFGLKEGYCVFSLLAL